ncbi:MAG: HAD family phosphatase [Chloroflexota bacterium]|nr:MAG: HAD family phosphatase [Chloroflexota bacterium]
MKKTIVFDLGGVLVDWNRRYLYQKIFSDQDELEYFLREICSLEWNAQMDVDKSFLDATDDLVLKYPEYETQIRAYFSRWEEMIRGDIPGTVEILGELKENSYPLAALSNWSSETFPRVKDQYEFLDWFSPLVISGYIGYKKPDPEPFQILLHELGRDAGDCLFIDDMEDNIQEARRQGFEVIHFTSPEKLRQELENRDYL